MLSLPQPSTTLTHVLTHTLTAAEQAGFVNVVVDTSDSLFAFDLDEGSASPTDTSDGSASTADTSEGSGSPADGSATTADACPRTADAGRGADADAPACPQGAEEETARRARNQARAYASKLVRRNHALLTSLPAYRRQVHVGSREFEHLRDYDMNALCARVVVTGTRPAAGS